MKWLYCLFLIAVSFNAQTKLPTIFGDNMVLQQKGKISIWGKDLPNSQINISTSWGAKSSTKVDENGIWKTKIKTNKASFNPEKITIKGSETITFKNVLIGEVWLCSGQSNMDMPMIGLGKSKVLNSDYYLNQSINKNIRLFNNPRAAALQPNFETGGKWVKSNRQSAKKFSAVGYMFAQQLFDKLKVPIGIIETACGGTRIESWLPKEYLIKYKDVKIPDKLHQDQKKQKKPSFLYNAMIYPFQDYKIKGILWYQGESNRTKPEPYFSLMTDLINSWRIQWKDRNLPFYFVQIAPYNYVKFKKGKLNNSNFIRDTQFKISQEIKNTGLVVTTDIGDCNDIHPSKKEEVSIRLANLALVNEYHHRNIFYKSPELKKIKIKGNKVKLQFNLSNKDYFISTSNIKGFSLAGSDKKFYSAKVKISKNKKELILSSKKITNPVAVRYGFDACFQGNLKTKSGLPIAVFRTDDW